MQIQSKKQSSISSKVSIDTIGQREPISAIGNLDRLASSWPTVAIPDIRVSARPSKPAVNTRDGFVANTQSSSSTVSNLESIRQAIESSLSEQNHDADGLDRIQEIDQLRAALDATNENQTPRDADVSEIPVTGNRLVGNACPLNSSDVSEQDVLPIVDSICSRFPKEVHSLVSFAASERNPQLGSVVGRTAKLLGMRTGGKILIVSGDTEPNNGAKPGRTLFDLNQRGSSWRDVVWGTSENNIDLVNIGPVEDQDPLELTTMVNRAVAQIFENQYEYVLVNVGDAHGVLANLWAKHVNGTFLLVSIERSSREMAKSAVAQLNAFGARLIGCVASECETN